MGRRLVFTDLLPPFFLPPQAFPPPPTTAKDKGKETLSKFNVAVIAGAAAGIVTLVVFVVIIAIVTKRQAKVVSIRNRVQVEAKHRASEDDKIASLFKPDDVKQIPLTRIEYIRDLGSWNFGSVFLGMQIHSRKQHN